ncbi:MAG: PTS sugar transporter subunit IIA [Alphaproteobacteria bacterium]|nr:PTS sugar transporter subunit IIA [Alphaproteobacteria bacterium]
MHLVSDSSGCEGPKVVPSPVETQEGSAMAHDLTYDRDTHIDLVFPALRVRGPEELWAHLATALAPRLGCPAHDMRLQMEGRAEAPAAACMGDGLAALHIESGALTHPLAVLAVLTEPLEVGAPDGAGVDMVYLLLSPPEPQGLALRRIARVARALKMPHLAARLRSETSPVAALALVSRMTDTLAEAA